MPKEARRESKETKKLLGMNGGAAGIGIDRLQGWVFDSGQF
jgi:hypothetical protein